MTASRTVQCIKLGQELPGLPFRPFPDELGQKIYDQVSMEAWQMWLRESPRIINTYRLDLQNPKHQAFLREQMEVFFGFREGDLAETAWRPPED